MALTAAAGILGFGPQTAKETTATTFYRHRAIDIDLGVNDDNRMGQLEIGGTPVPTFPYKAGYVVGGGFTIQPRLESTLGWLLYGAMGKCTSTESPGASGMYNHVFEMDTDASMVRWMSFRKVIPQKDGDTTTDLGETYTDCKVTGLQMQLPTDQPITSRVDVMGRTFALDYDPTAFTWANTYESWESIPVACSTGGWIKIGGVAYPIVNASYAWQNQNLDVRQEKIFGSPALEDVTIVTRQLSFDITVKYNTPALYAQTLTGSPSGTEWTPQPFVASFEAKTVSSKNMPTETEPYSLICQANNAVLQQQGGIRMAAGQAIMVRYAGTAIEGAGTYATFTLRNKQASYAWPT